MSFQPVNQSFIVDLDAHGASAWKRVLCDPIEVAQATALFTQAAKPLSAVPAWLRCAIPAMFRWEGGPHSAEMKAWAKATKHSFRKVTLLNCSYELSHLDHGFSIGNVVRFIGRSIVGCSTGIVAPAGLAPVHVRTLDWGFSQIGPATRFFEFRQKGAVLFKIVGVAGLSGVLTGMRPGAYSVTINWAPPAAIPDFHWGPAFIVRRTLERCATYETALAALMRTPLSASVFFTLCGAQPGEGCIIERTQDEAAIRFPNEGGWVAVTNHFQCRQFTSFNDTLAPYIRDGDEVAASSSPRLDELSEGLRRLSAHPPVNLSGYIQALNGPHVSNPTTAQRIVMCPATGEILAEWQ